MSPAITATVDMPRLLYGTAWKKAETERWVRTALEQGFRGFDTACQPRHYDEAGVGAGLAPAGALGVRREQLYLQTKFTPLDGQDAASLPYDPHAPLHEQVMQSFAASQRNLRTDYLDALLLHSPLDSDSETLVAWRALEEIAATGGIRRIGISNCYQVATLQTLHASARIKPTIVQNRFRAAEDYDRRIRAFCRAHALTYQSFWTLTANARVLAHAKVLRLAERHGRTPAQILFRYLTQVGIVPLSGTRSLAHMREDLAIFEFELSEDERAALDVLF